jgi:putative glutamine amidotransferase
VGAGEAEAARVSAVGVCAVAEPARWGPWDQPAALLPRTYTAAIQAAGAIALILPPDPAAAGSPKRILDRIDALLLAGGADIDPAAYEAERGAHVATTWPERDRFELALARAALGRAMQVLGICRGMQLLNVALGGTLVQHLPDLLGSDRHLEALGRFAEHEVRLEPGSLAARAVAAERTLVRSHHHQGVDRLGEGLAATGWSVADDLVEAIELPEVPFALGVLWHPEEDERSRVVGTLVEATRAEVAG